MDFRFEWECNVAGMLDLIRSSSSFQNCTEIRKQRQVDEIKKIVYSVRQGPQRPAAKAAGARPRSRGCCVHCLLLRGWAAPGWLAAKHAAKSASSLCFTQAATDLP